MTSVELIKQLKELGWYEVRRESSHYTFKNDSNPKIITVPHPKKDLPLGTLRQIKKIAGLK